MMALKRFFDLEITKKIFAVLFCLFWTVSLTLKGLYVQLEITINKAPVISRINFNMSLAMLFCFLIICGIVILIAGKRYKGLLIAMDALITLIFLADLLYGRYYYNPITVPILKQISFLNDVKDSTASLFRGRDLWLFVDFVLLAIGAYYLKGVHKKRPFYVQIIIGAIVIATGIVGFQFQYNKVDSDRFAYERKYIGRDLGLVYYHYYDVKTSIDKSLAANRKLTPEEIALIESANVVSKRGSNAYSGIGEGKNLMIIQLEAFQGFLIDLEVEGKEVTPFLNSLKEDSLYMSNYFIETAGGNTVDAELLTNTSMLPTYGGSAYYEFPSNTYLSLPKILKEKGYAVNSFHGYEASFWNREVMHKTLGFDRFYSLNDFDLTEKVGWAISDAAFFKQSLGFTMEASKGMPFYSFLITLSSHHPYDAFYSGPFTTSENSQDMLMRYMNAGNYVDIALQAFFDDLKASGLYEDTIVVIYGDHAGLFDKDAERTCEYFGLPYTQFEWQRFEKVPLFIHIPGTQGQTIDKVCGQSDLLPTLANIMNFDLKYTMSYDILDENYPGSIIRRSSNVVTNEYVYIAQDDKIYDFVSGKELNLADYQEDLQSQFNQLIAQDLIYRSDYLRKYVKE